MKKKLIIIGGAVVVFFIILGNLLGGSGGGVDVTAEAVERGTVVSKVSASGRIFPVTEVKINSQVSARIERLAVREGDQVVRGQVLVELDDGVGNHVLEVVPADVHAALVLLEGDGRS